MKTANPLFIKPGATCLNADVINNIAATTMSTPWLGRLRSNGPDEHVATEHACGITWQIAAGYTDNFFVSRKGSHFCHVKKNFFGPRKFARISQVTGGGSTASTTL